MDIFSLIATSGGRFPDDDDNSHILRTPRRTISPSSSKVNVLASDLSTSPQSRSTQTQTPPRPILSSSPGRNGTNLGENDMLSMSPVEQRLARARTKRQQILTERVQHIDNKCKAKEHSANIRHMDHTFNKVSKAQIIDELIIQAKSRREQLLEDRVSQIDVKLKLKESGASKRKEDVTHQRVERARSELAKSPIAKKRREQQLLLRIERAEATLHSRTARAQELFELHMLEKQQRACWMERKERAELRRGFISYEKRARLLETLDAKLEGAAIRNHRYKEEKTIKAGEDIVKAKEVARRVKAVREIQCFVRKRYNMKRLYHHDNNLDQHDAAVRLQKWRQWKLHVCKRRLFGAANSDTTTYPATETFKALETIVTLFPLVSDTKELRRRSPQPPPFETVTQKMMKAEALQMATSVVECIRSITGESAIVDGRTLLAICLIAIHPREVLGDEPMHTDESNVDEYIKGSHLLALSCRSLLGDLHQLFQAASDGERILHLKRLCTRSVQARTLFDWWKSLDKRNLLAGLSTQLEQSWVVYLTSSESLRYIAHVSGVEQVEKGSVKTIDPLMSVRLRLEASKSGSCSHIKRIRLSLNKLIGVDEGKEFVTNTKLAAQKIIEETNAGKDLKAEIDEMYRGLVPSDTPASSNASDSAHSVTIPVDLPDKIMSNRVLVHRILLTEPCDFDNLSWDGTSAQLPQTASPREFMASFAQPTPYNDESNMSVRIAQNMRLAFFLNIANDLEQGNYTSIRDLIHELHAKMRSLLPSRKDLHSHVNDHDVARCTSVDDIIRGLIRSGLLLASYLESPARSSSTLELIDCLKEFSSQSCNDNDHRPIIPYGIKSEELLVVASIAYIHHKADLCQLDVSNYKLQQAAPLVHLVGHEYEREHFVNAHGDYHSSTMAELQHMLPSTWNWIQNMQTLISGSSSVSACPSFDQNIEIVKGIGFVDGLLFTKSQTSVPEVLSFDIESIHHIRSEARYCVIASALALHACNISRVGTSVLGSTTLSDSVLGARCVLSSALKEIHYEQTHLEYAVIEAVCNLTKGKLHCSYKK
jgi:hypothetical protein